ncbi:MAG: hypothetical protein NWR21_01470 [Verrucomicrobiales bacterium]|nr:hypothetical protein [Verrucomicrobiales bacterium]MDP4937958.1 hypothetical protein [Verrucomicrobiales bacterium]
MTQSEDGNEAPDAGEVMPETFLTVSGKASTVKPGSRWRMN